MKDDKFAKCQKIVRAAAGAMLAFVVLCLVAAFCASLGGCATTKSHPRGVRMSDSYFVGKLESSIESFDRGIGEAVERSRGIESELERIDFLFGQYERLVGGLRNEVNSLRAEIERLEKVRDGGGDSRASVSRD